VTTASYESEASRGNIHAEVINENVSSFELDVHRDWETADLPFTFEDSLADFSVNADWLDNSSLDWFFATPYR
jgi:hypothetical protein